MANQSQFPGMDEVIRFLQEQKAKTVQSNRLPTPPTALDIESNARRVPRGNTPSTGQGIFNVAEGSGGALVRKALGGVAAAAPFIPSAIDFGQYLGEKYNDLANVDKARRSEGADHLPSLLELGYGGTDALKPAQQVRPVQPVQPVHTSPVQASSVAKVSNPASESMKLAGIPERSDDSPEDGEFDSAAPTVDDTQQADFDNEQVSLASGVPQETAPKSKDDEFLQAIFDMMGKTTSPVQETVSKASTDAIGELTGAPKAEAKETFGHKVKRFVVAGSGPINFNRIDEQEAGAKQAKTAFTDPQKLKADMAKSDIEGASRFNRESQLDQQRTAGMSPQMKFMLDLLGDRSKMNTEQGFRQQNLGTEHKNRMAEIDASGANQKLSPGAMREQAGLSMMDKYPDLFSPEVIKSKTGLDVSPQTLKTLTDARLKNDPMAMMVTELLQQRLGGLGKAGTPAKQNLTTKALSK